MTSLYGGKPGLSFILRKPFKSIEEMEGHFIEGDNYTDVWYGEYCLIDTENKNDPNNGKLYKRELIGLGDDKKPYTYVGQIVGSSASSPAIAFAEKNEDNQVIKLPGLTKEEYKNITIQYPGEEESKSALAYISTAKNTTPAITFTAGDKDEAKNIAQVTWTNIRFPDDESKGLALAELTLPTLTTVFTAESEKNPYKTTGLVASTEKLNPFYQTVALSIPRGVQGESVDSLKILSGKEIKDSGVTIEGSLDGIKDDYQYLFLTKKIEEGFDQNTSTSIYAYKGYILNPYNIIKNIDYTTDGELTITQTADKDITIPYVKNIVGNSNTGSEQWPLTFEMTGNKPNIVPKISLLNNIKIDEKTGQVIKTFYGKADDTNTILSWPKEINFENGKLTYSLTKGDPISLGEIIYTENLSFNSNNNNFYLKKNNKETEEFLSHIDVISGIETNEKGNFVAVSKDVSGGDSKQLLTSGGPLCPVGDISIEATKDKLNLAFKRIDPNGSVSTETGADGTTIVIPALQDASQVFVEDISFLDTTSPIKFNSILDNEYAQRVDDAVKKLGYEDSLQGDRKIAIQYKTSQEKTADSGEKYYEIGSNEIVSPSLGGIADIAVQNGQIYVLFTDPKERQQGQLENGSLGDLKPGWAKNINGIKYRYDELSTLNIEVPLPNSTSVVTVNAVDAGYFFWKKIGTTRPEGISFASVFSGNSEFRNSEGIKITEVIDENNEVIPLIQNNPSSWEDYLRLAYTPDDTTKEELNAGKIIAITFTEGEYQDNPITKYYFCQSLKSVAGGEWTEVFLGGSETGTGDNNNLNKNEIALVATSESEATWEQAEFQLIKTEYNPNAFNILENPFPVGVTK